MYGYDDHRIQAYNRAFAQKVRALGKMEPAAWLTEITVPAGVPENTAAFALVMPGILMLPCIRFAAMIRRQERKGYPFENGTAQLIDKGMTGTYLSDEWIIHAGYVALHHSQCAAVRSESRSASRFGLHHGIVIETIDGQVYRWPLSQRKVRIVREWLKQKQAEA